MKTATVGSLLTILAALLLLTGCVEMQADLISLDNRISALEQRQKELSQKPPPVPVSQKEENIVVVSTQQEQKDRQLREQSAQLRARVDRLNEEIRQLRNKIEETEHQLNRKITALDKNGRLHEARLAGVEDAASTVQQRMSELEGRLQNTATTSAATAAAGVAATPVVATTTETVPAVEMNEGELYQAAKKAFDSGDYPMARERFKELITKHPQSVNADNAQFWIGEVYYREKSYELAILEYQKVIENYPQGNKVQASLLKQGFAFYNLEDQANARLILEELIRRYPDSNEAKIARQKIKGFKQ